MLLGKDKSSNISLKSCSHLEYVMPAVPTVKLSRLINWRWLSSPNCFSLYEANWPCRVIHNKGKKDWSSVAFLSAEIATEANRPVLVCRAWFCVKQWVSLRWKPSKASQQMWRAHYPFSSPVGHSSRSVCFEAAKSDALKEGCPCGLVSFFFCLFILCWVLVTEIVVATGRGAALKVTYSVVPYHLAYWDNWINMWLHYYNWKKNGITSVGRWH